MLTNRSRSLLAAIAACIVADLAAAEVGRSAGQILTVAFDELYDYDMKMILRLDLETEQGETSTRRSEVARKRIRGHSHSYAHFLDPIWMRGTRMLLIDNTDRSDDVFLFLPENDRVRRLNSVQRSDAFLGSDFWYEDLERRHVTDYEILATSETRMSGHQYHQIDAAPRDAASGYARIRFLVGIDDELLWHVLFFRAASDQPFREIEFDRTSLIEREGRRIPTRVIVTNHVRRSRTTAHFEQLQVNPPLANSLFRSTALLTGRRIPGLTDEETGDE